MMKEFTATIQKFTENSDKLFKRVQNFCENALYEIDQEKIKKLHKAGVKLYESLSALEKEIKTEYIQEIKETMKNGQSSIGYLYNGLVEIGNAVYYAKQAVNQANTLLKAENLTNNERKRLKNDILKNLTKVTEHGAKGITLIVEGVSLAAKTIEQVKKISFNVSNIFKDMSTSFGLFKSQHENKQDKIKTSTNAKHKSKPRT